MQTDELVWAMAQTAALGCVIDELVASGHLDRAALGKRFLVMADTHDKVGERGVAGVLRGLEAALISGKS